MFGDSADFEPFKQIPVGVSFHVRGHNKKEIKNLRTKIYI